jgi:hypothetical protein
VWGKRGGRNQGRTVTLVTLKAVPQRGLPRTHLLKGNRVRVWLATADSPPSLWASSLRAIE